MPPGLEDDPFLLGSGNFSGENSLLNFEGVMGFFKKVCLFGVVEDMVILYSQHPTNLDSYHLQKDTFTKKITMFFTLVVSTHLKNISQMGSFPQGSG